MKLFDILNDIASLKEMLSLLFNIYFSLHYNKFLENQGDSFS